MDEIVLVPQKLVGEIAHKPITVAKKRRKENVMDWEHITKKRDEFCSRGPGIKLG